MRRGIPPVVTPLRGGAKVVPVKNLERDMVGGEVKKSIVQKIGAFLFPNVAALGERGVRGSALDNTVGALKAIYNAAQGMTIALNPSLLVSSALGNGPQELEIADNELGGAALVEGATAIFGVAGVTRTLAKNGTRLVIGKLDALTNVARGERTLGRLPDLGSKKANWAQNSSLLRQEMQRGQPIRDASVDSAGRLINNDGFLRLEREVLEMRGWTYNPATRMWHPPVR